MRSDVYLTVFYYFILMVFGVYVCSSRVTSHIISLSSNCFLPFIVTFFTGSLEGGVRYSNGSEFNESYLNSLKSISSNLGYLLTRREILVTTTM